MPKAAKDRKKPGQPGEDSLLPTSLTSCKKQVRNLTRSLSRPGLPSTVRVELERKLKALTVMQSQMTNAQKDKANATRYHSVKFFERKKIVRRLDQLDKLPEEEQTRETRKEKKRLLVDLNYTTYYPDEHKYISLFPGDPSKTTEDTKERREAIRTSIAEAMKSGELPKDARLVSVNDRKAIRKSNKSMLRRVARALGAPTAEGAEGDDDDDDDKGGNGEEDEFFA
ncbi:18S rRNA maturation protein [Coemansia nantahalensis]|uniref:18S rRNA maturation protein n=2 Tax=Coemansia TaxID=4863 RepID=A0ACC1L6A5_9FUNG|nr:18S rRNA maturation protein [Coemansia nantahalensis]KAJ2801599.1 18S rRNA maturation protein [Coemansia helicoidea]